MPGVVDLLNARWIEAIFSPDFHGLLKGQFPNEEALSGKWHNLAIACKSHQMKIYIDQHRVLVIPDYGFEPTSLIFGGSLNARIKNVKIAGGGGMNMLDKILTDGKFISHAVTFNSGKSEMQGESMGFLNELARWFIANANVNIDIGGRTDSDGNDDSNLKLSCNGLRLSKRTLFLRECLLQDLLKRVTEKPNPLIKM